MTGRDTWRFVVLAWLSSRLLFLVAGGLGGHLLYHAGANLPDAPSGLLRDWAHWDGAWYSSIARFGYFETLWPSSTNFFPFYPLLLRLGMFTGIGAAIVGVAISLAASLAALYFAHELARDYFNRDVARAATLALAFFPTAFYLNAVYSEAVFLAAALGSLWSARIRGDFVFAGVFGCFAAMTRNVGVLLILPLVQEWVRQRRQAGLTGLAALALVPAGLLAYMFWLWRWSSHPLLFSTVVHRTWGRTLTNPVHVFDRAWRAARFGAHWVVHPDRLLETHSVNASFDLMGTLDFAVLILLAALLLVVFARLPLGLSAYAAGTVLLPVLTPPQVLPLASFSRYALADFPVFFALGLVLTKTRLLAGWLALSAAVGVVLTLEFTSVRWVG